MKSFVIINPKDNVAIALRCLSKGTRLSFERDGKTDQITLKQEIPIGHKLALVDIPKRATVIKYGEVIGYAKQFISKGKHVHVHNILGRDEI